MAMEESPKNKIRRLWRYLSDIESGLLEDEKVSRNNIIFLIHSTLDS